MSLTVSNLARSPILAPLSFAVAPGELVGLIGPNGAGKTTLLRALAGLTQGLGDVRIDGIALTAMHPRARARRLAWLPADRGTVWPMRGRDIVALGLMPLGARDDTAIDAALAAREPTIATVAAACSVATLPCTATLAGGLRKPSQRRG